MVTVFSPAETYNLKSQWYANLWDNVLANAFGEVANNLGAYSKYANSTLWAYDSLLNFMAWNEWKLQTVAWNLYNQLVNDINDQKTYVYDMFWPEGSLTKEVNQYYDDLWNYLATDAGRQAAIIAAQWQHSGASLWAIRAQQNEAYNESFARYVQAKEQQINAKQQIASNLINFMATLRQEYWDTTNQYVIELYKRAYDLYNNVALSVAQDMMSYNQLRFSGSWSSWGSSISWVDLLPRWLTKNEKWEVVDSDWNKYERDATNWKWIQVKSNTPTSGWNSNSSLESKIQDVNDTNFLRKLRTWVANISSWLPRIWPITAMIEAVAQANDTKQDRSAAAKNLYNRRIK